MTRDELAAWLRLMLTPGVGLETARKLLLAFGLPEQVFGQSSRALQQVVSTAQTSALQAEPAELPELLARTWDWLRADRPDGTRAQVLTLGDADYPPSLLQLPDPPLMLYLLGRSTFPLNTAIGHTAVGDSATESIVFDVRRSIAIVGSRNPSAQGALHAHDFALALGQAGLTVVSGLALGVDAAAHEGALHSLRPGELRLATVAVVGTGLDRVYPKNHLDLARRIASHGLLLSEYPLGTPPLAANFPRRNRLIAALSQGTLVVEAALKSGSLITARLAADQGREVFAIPGSIHATQARGCHALIKQGAKLVESAQDVLDELKLDLVAPDAMNSVAKEQMTTGLSDQNKPDAAVLAALGTDPVGLDALQARCGLDAARLQTGLMLLELDGQVARLPGGLFQRLHRR
ncbi:MAG: DNA-protecting protein DprA [Pseudomonadota bacterium]|jgi:DNA processing protein